MMDEQATTHDTLAGGGRVEGGTGAVPSPVELLRIWRLRRDRCKTRVQKDCCVLSPMDEALWFNIPTVNVVTVTNGSDEILARANPMRVAILFGCTPGASSSNIAVMPGQSALNASGVLIGFQLGSGIGAAGPRFIPFTQAEYGPLPAMEWHGSCTGAQSIITVVEIVLKDWPQIQE